MLPSFLQTIDFDLPCGGLMNSGQVTKPKTFFKIWTTSTQTRKSAILFFTGRAIVHSVSRDVTSNWLSLCVSWGSVVLSSNFMSNSSLDSQRRLLASFFWKWLCHYAKRKLFYLCWWCVQHSLSACLFHLSAFKWKPTECHLMASFILPWFLLVSSFVHQKLSEFFCQHCTVPSACPKYHSDEMLYLHLEVTVKALKTHLSAKCFTSHFGQAVLFELTMGDGFLPPVNMTGACLKSLSMIWFGTPAGQNQTFNDLTETHNCHTRWQIFWQLLVCKPA